MSLEVLSEPEAEALSRMQENPDFRVFLSLLGEEMAKMNEKLIKVDMPEIEKNTLIGQLRMGSRLTDAVVGSKHTLQQHKQPKT